jgi:hypothetical protein
MRRRQPQTVPAPEPQVDEYAEVRIPFDVVLRKLTNTPAPPKKAAAKRVPTPKKS